VGAILISSAKLAITTVCGGIHPWRQIPVVLDCGTDVRYISGTAHYALGKYKSELTPTQNQELLEDELYLGLRCRRVRGKEYRDFVDRFIQAARKKFPKAYIHL
jgi:malate dehydrogenase (oxaloacetate-decarboxylating)